MVEFTPRNPNYQAAVTEYAREQAFLTLLGVRLGDIAPGEVSYLIDYRPEVGQHRGFFHGGVIGGLSEAVMGAAAFSLVEPSQTVFGAEYKINFISPGEGAILKAVGSVLKPGRTLSVCRADIFVISEDGSSKRVAAAQGAMATVPA
ncbi:MAG: PaaI family thioesterase [Magnetovibrionaceae bacterium]